MLAPFLSLSLVGIMSQSEPFELKVMTYNIRLGTGQDGENSWPYRKQALTDLILRHNPDVLGVQEALPFQMTELRASLPNHEVVGVGREDGLTKGEWSAIFTRQKKLGLREGGTRWISDTPEKPNSLGPGARITRIFSWGEFFTSSGKRILLINTHFDHQSDPARKLGAEQMVAFAKSRGELPTVITGDFNCSFGNPAINHIVEAGFIALKPASGPIGTFNGFDPKKTTGEMIDLIFVSSHWEATSVEIDFSAPGGKVPSDHFPVISTIRLKP
ncbi:MAG: endonuclease/exonuclease/phosphatase family protein [Fimbriimonadaceae bacterium]|jgi:endonuclease/exonuclease/phosphatase family metal-dependent hydrolase|nr:endonuclease/exonuclease/phosphatase family protein [Fimbriimonadaceae bacterium]